MGACCSLLDRMETAKAQSREGGWDHLRVRAGDWNLETGKGLLPQPPDVVCYDRSRRGHEARWVGLRTEGWVPSPGVVCAAPESGDWGLSSSFLTSAATASCIRSVGMGRTAGSAAPPGLGSIADEYPQLTLWAIVCRCSAPGVRSLGVRLGPVCRGFFYFPGTGAGVSGIAPISRTLSVAVPSGMVKVLVAFQDWMGCPSFITKPTAFRS